MPVVDAFSQVPHGEPPFDDSEESFAIRLCIVGGLRLYLSYSVFLAAAVLLGVLVTLQNQQGNRDLPTIAIVGAMFWVCGWIVQLAVYAFMRFSAAVPIQSVTIGLLGIESRHREWTAKQALVVSLVTLVTLVAVGFLMIFAEQIVNGTRPWSNVANVWKAPGFGLHASEFVWVAGAWLLWVQATCQAYPLPKSLGRVVITSSVYLMAAPAHEKFQVLVVRRLLQICAISTAFLAVGSFVVDYQPFLPRWPFLSFLGLVLWVTSYHLDLVVAINGFNDFSEWDDGQLVAPAKPSPLTRLRDAIDSLRSRGKRKRLRAIQKREHQEASDIQRLDDVLQQLHTSGRDSLSAEDIALLDRVSQSIKRQREQQEIPPPSGSESDF